MHWQVSAAEPWQGRRGWCLFDCTGQVAVLLLATERNTSREFLLLQAFHDLVLSHGRCTRIAWCGPVAGTAREWHWRFVAKGRPSVTQIQRQSAIGQHNDQPSRDCRQQQPLPARVYCPPPQEHMLSSVQQPPAPTVQRRTDGPAHTAGAQRCDRRDGSVAARWLR